MSSASSNSSITPRQQALYCCSERCMPIYAIDPQVIARIALCIISKVKIYNLEKTLNSATNKISSMEQALLSADESIERIEANKKECMDMLEKFRREGQQTWIKLNLLNADLEAFEGSDLYSKRREQLQAAIDQLTERANFLADAIEQSQKILADSDREIERIESSMPSQEWELTTLNFSLVGLNYQIDVQRALVKKLENQLGLVQR